MVLPQEASEGLFLVNQVIPYTADNPTGVDTHENLAAASHIWTGSVDRQDSLCLDDQFLADFEWALGDGGLFPTEPYCQTWSSSGSIL